MAEDPYIRWYYSSRCLYCSNDQEIIVDRTAEPEEHILGTTSDGFVRRVFLYPSETGKLCYYHRKIKEGRFNGRHK